MTILSRRTVIRSLAVAPLGLIAACEVASQQKLGGAVGVPHGPAVLGAYVSPLNYALTSPQNALASKQFARPMRIDGQFIEFFEAFPGARAHAAVASRQVPLVTWKPSGLRLNDITRGRYDSMLRQRAQQIKAFGSPILLRFGHEMNGTWYSWASQSTDAPKLGNTPQAYTAAWRHIHELFAVNGARNVSWVWCPSAIDVPSDNRLEMYYPGSTVVDWVGLDVYTDDNAIGQAANVAAFADIVGMAASRLDSAKPLILAEVGFAGSANYRIREFRSVPTVVERTPRLKALVYFDSEEFSPSYSAAVAVAARQMAHSSILNGQFPNGVNR